MKNIDYGHMSFSNIHIHKLLATLMIDNGVLALISLRFTFLLIPSWLLGPS